MNNKFNRLEKRCEAFLNSPIIFTNCNQDIIPAQLLKDVINYLKNICLDDFRIDTAIELVFNISTIIENELINRKYAVYIPFQFESVYDLLFYLD